jgi:hypothetical protein
MLSRILEHKRDELMGGWRKCYDELSSLSSLPDIIRVIISRKMRLAGYVERMGI